MKRILPLLLFIAIAISFYAGYTLGMKKAQLTAPKNSEIVSESTTMPKQPSPVVEAPSETELAPAAPETEVMLADHEHSLRAAKKEIRFTDNQGRELVAEVIEANADTLKVRRIADNATMNLPVAMLCDADREFAAYLAKHNTSNSSTSLSTSGLMEDKVWDELFK